jgi:hypothetical protein
LRANNVSQFFPNVIRPFLTAKRAASLKRLSQQGAKNGSGVRNDIVDRAHDG